jgi:hypothetical protein
MIEINGWVSIHITTDGEEESDTLKEVINELNQYIQLLAGFNQFFEIKPLNGFYTLFVGLNHNHDNGYYDLVHQLLNEIGTQAPGSYGVVYVRNHEDNFDFNKFKVLKIARGIVTEEDDKLISPCNPIIEN